MKTPLTRLSLLALLIFATPASAYAQLDPLQFLKATMSSSADLTTTATLRPNVILAVDTSQRMQVDGEHNYYDPGTYTETGAAYEAVMGLSAADATTSYRRKLIGFTHLSGADKFSSTRIEAVGDAETSYETFFERTRLAVARRAMIRAITDNTSSVRFALVRMRQAAVVAFSAGNDGPVLASDSGQQTPSDGGSAGRWLVTRTLVGSSNTAQTVSGLLTGASTSAQNTTILTRLGKSIGTSGALLPAGQDSYAVVDSPVGLLLDDARAHATTLVTNDTTLGGCRNTIVVLIVGGAEGTIAPQDLAAKAATFLNVGGRRVPIYVVALFPAAGDVAALQAIATGSGGQYFEITQAMADAVRAGNPIPEAVRAINTAIQHAFVPSTTFNATPTPALPFGQSHEIQVTSPIVGTVNLLGASKLDASGSLVPLPDSETQIYNGTAEVPQRSNVLVTSGFELPGFAGKLRAFRTYKPVADSTKPSGYKFTQDGSRLWVSSTPAAGLRNIYTVLPGSSTMVAFDVANVNQLDDYLGVSDPSDLITAIRQLPMGAIVGSTPAFMDVPSLDPPPDADYPGFREANKGRRSLIFVGANDGMLHALDARTGIEVWAFIPFNLLPKLRALRYGQPLDAFAYYVDSSPKIADVKVVDDWRTYLFFGQGSGGTFYNTLDVTLDDMADTVEATSTNDSALLAYFASADRVKWKWSFPRNTSFDATLAPYGELSPTASAVEQTVGETWSDPAVGQVQDEDGPYVMVTGSGFLKYSVQSTRRLGATRSGTTFYVLDIATGDILGTPRDVGADANAETLDDCRTINDCRKMKNALQMDPVATGPLDQRFMTKVYIGDLDGKVWRFGLSVSSGTLSVSTPTQLYNAGADFPLFSSMATVNVGGSNQYIFVGTGSDLLPSNGVGQSYNLLVLLDKGTSASKTGEITLEKTDFSGGDEKVTSFPAVAGDIVFFTTTTYNPLTGCTPFTANLYAFTFIGGPAYDTNNSGSLTGADSKKVFSTTGARATAPFIVDQHLAFSTGGNIQLFGDPDDFNNGVGQAGVRILSWRQVR